MAWEGRIVHCKESPYDVYIGRAGKGKPQSKFGNPWVIGVHGSREEVIESYRRWLKEEIEAPNSEVRPTRHDIDSLKGKILGCWCHYPNQNCHGTVLLELAEGRGPKYYTGVGSRETPEHIVSFDPETHIYRRTDTGERLISVSQLIKCYREPFDKDGAILRKCAEREGVSPAELRKRWDKKRDDAGAYGSRVHAQVEAFIKTGEIAESEDQDIVREFSKLRFKGRLESEKMLWSLDDGIAGTTDIVEHWPDGSVGIFDLKTNEAIKRNSFFGRGKPQKMMLPPVEGYPDSNFWSYTLQISVYSYLLDLQGLWVKRAGLLWVNPKSREIEPMEVEYRRGDVLAMLRNFKENKARIMKEHFSVDSAPDLE